MGNAQSAESEALIKEKVAEVMNETASAPKKPSKKRRRADSHDEEEPERRRQCDRTGCEVCKDDEVVVSMNETASGVSPKGMGKRRRADSYEEQEPKPKMQCGSSVLDQVHELLAMSYSVEQDQLKWAMEESTRIATPGSQAPAMDDAQRTGFEAFKKERVAVETASGIESRIGRNWVLHHELTRPEGVVSKRSKKRRRADFHEEEEPKRKRRCSRCGSETCCGTGDNPSKKRAIPSQKTTRDAGVSKKPAIPSHRRTPRVADIRKVRSLPEPGVAYGWKEPSVRGEPGYYVQCRVELRGSRLVYVPIPGARHLTQAPPNMWRDREMAEDGAFNAWSLGLHRSAGNEE